MVCLCFPIPPIYFQNLYEFIPLVFHCHFNRFGKERGIFACSLPSCTRPQTILLEMMHIFLKKSLKINCWGQGPPFSPYHNCWSQSVLLYLLTTYFLGKIRKFVKIPEEVRKEQPCAHENHLGNLPQMQSSRPTHNDFWMGRLLHGCV